MINEAYEEDETKKESSVGKSEGTGSGSRNKSEEKGSVSIERSINNELSEKTRDYELTEVKLTNYTELNDLGEIKGKIQPCKDDDDSKSHIGWSCLNITVEPIRFFVFFITSFTNGIITDLMELSVCQRKFDFTYSQCVGNMTSDLKVSLQSDLASVLMINDLVKGIFPVALVLFLGPWSDVNGRKPWLLWVMRGFAATHFSWLILSMFPSAPIYYFVIPGIPYSLSGGLVTINICTWSYVCDIYNSDERPYRFSIFSMVALVGSLTGNLMAAEVFYMAGEYGYQVVFSLTTIIALLTLLYTSKVIKETVIVQEGEQTRLFDLANLKSVFEVLLIKPINGHLRTFLVLLTLTMEITARTGDDHLAYLVGKSEYSWMLRDYNFFASLTFFISAMVPVPGVWLLQEKLKFHNHVVLFFAGTIMFSSELIRSLAVSESMFWIASCLLMISAFIGPNIDTELSKCVSEENLGKACAFVSLVDASTPIISVPMYTRLYQFLLPLHKTLYTYLLSAAFSTVLISSVIALSITHRLSVKKLLIFRENMNESQEKADAENTQVKTS